MSAINDLRGIVSDWLLGLAIDLAPKDDQPQLCAALLPYLSRALKNVTDGR